MNMTALDEACPPGPPHGVDDHLWLIHSILELVTAGDHLASEISVPTNFSTSALR